MTSTRKSRGRRSSREESLIKQQEGMSPKSKSLEFLTSVLGFVSSQSPEWLRRTISFLVTTFFLAWTIYNSVVNLVNNSQSQLNSLYSANINTATTFSNETSNYSNITSITDDIRIPNNCYAVPAKYYTMMIFSGFISALYIHMKYRDFTKCTIKFEGLVKTAMSMKLMFYLAYTLIVLFQLICFIYYEVEKKSTFAVLYKGFTDELILIIQLIGLSSRVSEMFDQAWNTKVGKILRIVEGGATELRGIDKTKGTYQSPATSGDDAEKQKATAGTKNQQRRGSKQD